MKLFKFVFRWTWRLVLVVVLFFNLRLYVPSPLPRGTRELPATLIQQLNANRLAIDAGAPKRMQKLFPEGYYFCHVMHGLTWVEAALRDPGLTKQALLEARASLQMLETPEAKSPFPAALPPNHGMFYSAWKAHLCAGIVLLENDDRVNECIELKKQCDSLAAAFKSAETPFLPSYDGRAWPCDSIPAIHAMKIHDCVTNSNRYTATIEKWLSDVKSRLDPDTGLIPHTSNFRDGSPTEVARGTSQMIILRMLPDIDAEFAKQQYEIFRDRFYTTFLGAPCVLEYPSGIRGRGDVDSGPLIFGRSVSATVFMIGVAQIYGDQSIADSIAQAGETVGMPWTSKENKRYVGGLLPVGDIMVAYSQNARPWLELEKQTVDKKVMLSAFWRLPTHLISLCLLIPTLIAWKAERRNVAPVETTSNEN